MDSAPQSDRTLPPTKANSFRQMPDSRGHFGDYGGRYVAETLMPLILELETAYRAAQADPAFAAQFDDLMEHYVGRPSPLYFAERLTEALGGAQVWFKRDELNHTGAHKINNCIGQILLAIRMGKKKIIAETGAGQHGVATATVCARFGLPCTIFMGATDVSRQQPNVFRMKLLGAEVIPVTSGAATLKDAMNEALRHWVANVEDTFYIIGTAAGPHPYPEMVRDFQSVIGKEARAQMLARTGRLPDLLVAAIGGGSNAIGLFHPFLDDAEVKMLGVEAAGHGLDKQHAASLAGGFPGVLHGNKTYLLQDADGQIAEAHSISAGLDYPGIGPEHAWLKDTGRVEYTADHRRRGVGRLPAPLPHRGHHSRARTQPRHRRRRQAREGNGPRRDHPRQPVRARRQGHLHRGRSIWEWRCEAAHDGRSEPLHPDCSGRPVRLHDRPHRVLRRPARGDRRAGRDRGDCHRGDRDGRVVAPRQRAHAMNRLASAFAKGRPALVCFITAGDGDTAANLDALVAGGADVIELGMPFTDPMADGPAIQKANLRSLGAGTTTADVLADRQRVPRAPPGRAAGADGLCQSDDPPRARVVRRRGRRVRGRRGDLRRHSARGGRRARPCAARRRGSTSSASPPPPPTPRGCRLCSMARRASSITSRSPGSPACSRPRPVRSPSAVARLKAATDLPIAVGFGVRTPEQASAIAKVADGVVVGSALVELVEQHGANAPEHLKRLTASLAEAVHTARKDVYV